MGIMYRCSLGGGGETCEFIAPDYDANKTDYAADDVVLKDGKVMKYNGSEWEDFSLAECTTLNSNLGKTRDIALICWSKVDSSYLIENDEYIVCSPRAIVNGQAELLKLNGYSIIAIKECDYTLTTMSGITQSGRASANQTLMTVNESIGHAFVTATE